MSCLLKLYPALSYMDEVMPKKEGNSESNVLETVVDLDGFLPKKTIDKEQVKK